MTKKKSVTINGVTYPSIKSACDAYGTKIITCYQRIRRGGWSLEKAITTPTLTSEEACGKSVTIDGVEYPSLQKAAKNFGISVLSLKNHLRRGLHPTDKIVFTELMHPVCVNDVEYESKVSAIKAHNISRQAVYQRMQKGMSFSEAVSTKKQIGKKNHPVIIEGVKYINRTDAVKAYRLNYSDVLKTSKQDNIDFGEAIIKLKNEKAKKKIITVDGKEYSSLAKAALSLGVSLSGVYYYSKKHGISYSEALSTIKEKKKRKPKNLC